MFLNLYDAHLIPRTQLFCNSQFLYRSTQLIDMLQEQEAIQKLEQSKSLLEQEIRRVKKGLEDTQSQLDELKAEKKNLALDETYISSAIFFFSDRGSIP